ncbi:MAG: DUF2314 domain-containing protein, partial [Paracoccaceae bacterium]
AILALMLAVTPALAQDPVTPFAADDATMNAAIAEAQRTLPLFLANALDAESIGREGTGVKVGMPTVPGGAMELEHIWVTPFRLWPDGTLSGYLANAPVELGALRQGDRVDFTQDQISDWSFAAPDGLLYGNYTSRVMHAAGAFGDTPFEAIFPADPIPMAWQ